MKSSVGAQLLRSNTSGAELQISLESSQMEKMFSFFYDSPLKPIFKIPHGHVKMTSWSEACQGEKQRPMLAAVNVQITWNSNQLLISRTPLMHNYTNVKMRHQLKFCCGVRCRCSHGVHTLQGYAKIKRNHKIIFSVGVLHWKKLIFFNMFQTSLDIRFGRIVQKRSFQGNVTMEAACPHWSV